MVNCNILTRAASLNSSAPACRTSRTSTIESKKKFHIFNSLPFCSRSNMKTWIINAIFFSCAFFESSDPLSRVLCTAIRFQGMQSARKTLFSSLNCNYFFFAICARSPLAMGILCMALLFPPFSDSPWNNNQLCSLGRDSGITRLSLSTLDAALWGYQRWTWLLSDCRGD